ncbi:MAG: acetyltransferase [Verrucomicrobia bacterium]|nr:acetyltransferase [Verrucomicrobiota bacterium]
MTNSSPPTPLLILGARPYSLAFADAFEDVTGFEIVGYVENRERERAGTWHGGRMIYWVDDLPRFRESHQVICSLGTTFRNQFTEPVKAMGLTFATLVHPTATVSRRSTLGEGTSISIGSIIAGFTTVGCHVHVNRGVNIGHHTLIEDFVTIGPGVNLAGNCHVGAHTYVGIGATIIDGIKIGRHCVIGAGAVVTQDLPDRVLAVGVPAKVVKEGIEGK